MDFADTPAEAAFRAECREWLAAHATPRAPTAGIDVTAILDPDLDEEAGIVRAKEWQTTAARDGWAAVAWPREYGGRGVDLALEIVYQQERSRFDVPDHLFRIGTMLAGPTLIAHATDDQKRRWLPPLLRGEEIWCQLFSEPSAGSDLASLRTSAARDGDTWIVNGQKVWSSGAHHAQRGMLLARTDPEAPKHQGITYFGLAMDTPGVEVRPLRQITGGSHFNEVFLTDVRVRDCDRIGDVNAGWGVAQTTLLNERAGIVQLVGEGAIARGLAELAVRAEADGRPGRSDARVRQELAAVAVDEAILRYLGLRIVTAFSRGELPGPEASVAKLAIARLVQRAADVALRLGGPAALAGAPELREWALGFLVAPSLRIAGGSDEIQRNIIGERVLGLPKEPAPG
ncbi:MAG TPA: acyl-CoA dehydrogenase family protein [Acidimicrobiia bacterium]|nr:acyl-CoA dehydrogenase family protein [Acidimicrobiia bacterium]